MSSKLVKKLLQQTTIPSVTNNEYYDDSIQNRSRNRYMESRKNETKATKISKDDIVQEHVQSLLRLDHLINKHSSKTANKSFDRHSSNIKKEQKEKQSLKRSKNAGIGAVGNSRSSSSSFSQKPHEKRFDKEREKRRRDEGYFEDLAKALKRAKKSKKKK